MKLALSLSLLTLAAFAMPGSAFQDGTYKYHHGGLGDTHIEGHSGHDYMVDPVGGDTDTMTDSEGPGSDGVNDVMDATDGDNQDTMVGGLEDTFKGDPGDTVIIVGEADEEGNAPVIFKGTLEQWEAILEFLEKWLTWTWPL